MSSSQNSSSSEPAAAAMAALAPLYDVVCCVDVMLGSASLSVRKCLELEADSIIRLGASAGSDMDVLVNGVAIAHGEIVIVDDSTAIRVTGILAPTATDGEA